MRVRRLFVRNARMLHVSSLWTLLGISHNAIAVLDFHLVIQVILRLDDRLVGQTDWARRATVLFLHFIRR
jgi:hypothetical protein